MGKGNSDDGARDAHARDQGGGMGRRRGRAPIFFSLFYLKERKNKGKATGPKVSLDYERGKKKSGDKSGDDDDDGDDGDDDKRTMGANKEMDRRQAVGCQKSRPSVVAKRPFFLKKNFGVFCQGGGRPTHGRARSTRASGARKRVGDTGARPRAMAMPPTLARRQRRSRFLFAKKREQREKGGKKETKEDKGAANGGRPSMAPAKRRDNNNGGSDNNKRSATKKSLAMGLQNRRAT